MRDLDRDGLDGALESSSTITGAIPAPPLNLRPEMITPLEPDPRFSTRSLVAGVAVAGFLIGAVGFLALRAMSIDGLSTSPDR